MGEIYQHVGEGGVKVWYECDEPDCDSVIRGIEFATPWAHQEIRMGYSSGRMSKVADMFTCCKDHATVKARFVAIDRYRKTVGRSA